MFGALFFIQGANASGANWLSGWSFRKSHVINNAAGAGVGYQVQITVYYGSGADSGSNVYCSGLCQTNFGDVRFTASDGVTLLNYWIKSYVSGNNAIFWVQDTDNLTATTSTVYVYYGNPSAATTTSNGAAAFNMFSQNPTGYGWVNDTANNPVLAHGSSGSWDSGGVFACSCVNVGGTYFMYYIGFTTDVHANGQIGLATSTNGVTFTKYSGNPIIPRTGSGWSYSVDDPCVCYTGGTYYMIYSGYNSTGNSAAMLATSTNGYNWANYASNPVLNDKNSWVNSRLEAAASATLAAHSTSTTTLTRLAEACETLV